MVTTSDVAILYQVETKRINEVVKNNPDRFPQRFSWFLSSEEKNILWSKFSTANISVMSRESIHRARNIYACDSFTYECSGRN